MERSGWPADVELSHLYAWLLLLCSPKPFHLPCSYESPCPMDSPHGWHTWTRLPPEPSKVYSLADRNPPGRACLVGSLSGSKHLVQTCSSSCGERRFGAIALFPPPECSHIHFGSSQRSVSPILFPKGPSSSRSAFLWRMADLPLRCSQSPSAEPQALNTAGQNIAGLVPAPYSF